MSAATLRQASARTVPCPEAEMVISNDEVAATWRTWTVTCRSLTYDCRTTTKYATDTTCAPAPDRP